MDQISIDDADLALEMLEIVAAAQPKGPS